MPRDWAEPWSTNAPGSLGAAACIPIGADGWAGCTPEAWTEGCFRFLDAFAAMACVKACNDKPHSIMRRL